VQWRFQDEDSFEVTFNKSFIAIQAGDWAAAEEHLVLAESKHMSIELYELRGVAKRTYKRAVTMLELCRETFGAEGVSEAEIEEEVAVIKTQLAFVKQMQGDLDGALSDYRNVLKIKYACPDRLELWL
jgi:hypothetical protein